MSDPKDIHVMVAMSKILGREGKAFTPETIPISMTHQHGFSREWELQPCGLVVSVSSTEAPLPEHALAAAIADHRAECAECQAAEDE